MAVDCGGGALSRDVAELTGRELWGALRSGVRDHGSRERVFGLSLHGGHQIELRVGANG